MTILFVIFACPCSRSSVDPEHHSNSTTVRRRDPHPPGQPRFDAWDAEGTQQTRDHKHPCSPHRWRHLSTSEVGKSNGCSNQWYVHIYIILNIKSQKLKLKKCSNSSSSSNVIYCKWHYCISWRGHHDRVMQLNWLSCNHQSISMPSYFCSAALV